MSPINLCVSSPVLPPCPPLPPRPPRCHLASTQLKWSPRKNPSSPTTTELNATRGRVATQPSRLFLMVCVSRQQHRSGDVLLLLLPPPLLPPPQSLGVFVTAHWLPAMQLSLLPQFSFGHNPAVQLSAVVPQAPDRRRTMLYHDHALFKCTVGVGRGPLVGKRRKQQRGCHHHQRLRDLRNTLPVQTFAGPRRNHNTCGVSSGDYRC